MYLCKNTLFSTALGVIVWNKQVQNKNTHRTSLTVFPPVLWALGSGGSFKTAQLQKQNKKKQRKL